MILVKDYAQKQGFPTGLCFKSSRTEITDSYSFHAVENLIGRSFKPFTGDAVTIRSCTINIIVSLCGLFIILVWEASMVYVEYEVVIPYCLPSSSQLRLQM